MKKLNNYHFFILLLLDKEMVHSLVVGDLCEFLGIYLGKVLNERQIFLQHITIQLHPRFSKGIS